MEKGEVGRHIDCYVGRVIGVASETKKEKDAHAERLEHEAIEADENASYHVQMAKEELKKSLAKQMEAEKEEGVMSEG